MWLAPRIKASVAASGESDPRPAPAASRTSATSRDAEAEPDAPIPEGRLLGGRLAAFGFAMTLHALAAVLLFARWVSSSPPPTEVSSPVMLQLAPLPPEQVKPIEPPHPVRLAQVRPPPAKAEPTSAPAPVIAPEVANPEAAVPLPRPETLLAKPEIADDNPPPPSISRRGEVTFEGLLLARIEQFRRYPPEAARRGEQGAAQLHFRMNRRGHVLQAEIVGSSGTALLDAEALRTLRRAEPLPQIPPDLPDELDVSVPVEFALRPAVISANAR